MPFKAFVESQQPLWKSRLTPAQARFFGLSSLKRAILILCDGMTTAYEISQQLHRSFDEVADVLFDFYWSGLVEGTVLDYSLPPDYTVAYAYAPLPLSVQLFCSGGVPHGRSRSNANQHAQFARAGIRPGQQPGGGRGRPVHGDDPRSLFAA